MLHEFFETPISLYAAAVLTLSILETVLAAKVAEIAAENYH
jgi:hypothetical protein